METRKKAKEIYKKYKSICDNLLNNSGNKELAKQYSLIAVNQVIESHYKLLSGVNPSVYNFWKEVKQEIKKL
jgi:hypothetical protein